MSPKTILADSFLKVSSIALFLITFNVTSLYSSPGNTVYVSKKRKSTTNLLSYFPARYCLFLIDPSEFLLNERFLDLD
jgi:hypothetical protein